MLDVYQVGGIVKQSQAEIRLKFEQDHPDVVEFLAESICKEAKKGNTEMILHIPCRIIQQNIEPKTISKYLNFKGFYSDVLWGNDEFKIWSQYKDSNHENAGLKINWPKG
jgi:hypothetical protein